MGARGNESCWGYIGCEKAGIIRIVEADVGCGSCKKGYGEGVVGGRVDSGGREGCGGSGSR